MIHSLFWVYSVFVSCLGTKNIGYRNYVFFCRVPFIIYLQKNFIYSLLENILVSTNSTKKRECL